MGKLINRILVLQKNARFASLGIKFTWLAFWKPCLVNLISKDTHQVFSISYLETPEWIQIISTNAEILKVKRVPIVLALSI